MFLYDPDVRSFSLTVVCDAEGFRYSRTDFVSGTLLGQVENFIAL